MKRIANAIGAAVFFALLVNALLSPVRATPTGNPDYDNGVQIGKWLAVAFLVGATFICLNNAVRGSRPK